jgi:hypothetical protein
LLDKFSFSQGYDVSLFKTLSSLSNNSIFDVNTINETISNIYGFNNRFNLDNNKGTVNNNNNNNESTNNVQDEFLPFSSSPLSLYVNNGFIIIDSVFFFY